VKGGRGKGAGVGVAAVFPSLQVREREVAHLSLHCEERAGGGPHVIRNVKVHMA
jgi:hypothetical protein